KAFYKLFKLNQKDVSGNSLFDIDKGKWEASSLRALLEETALKGESPNDYELRYESAKTGKRQLLCNARKISGQKGKRQLILLAMEDVTDKRTLEQQRNDFVSIASHELKTPVTSIKG